MPNRCAALPPRNRDLVVVAQRRGGEDVIHRMLLPWNRVVAADDDLARPDLGDQMTERLPPMSCESNSE